jgi:hypothetical protein
VFIVGQPSAGQIHSTNTADRYLGNVAEVKYLGTTLNNKNYIHEEIKISLNWGIACRSSVKNVFSHLIHKNTTHRILYFVVHASRYMRVMNQLDALFIFSLFSRYTSTCFGLVNSPSSGGNNVYMRRLVRVVHLSLLSASMDGNPGLPAVDQDVQTVPVVTYIHCYLLMMGY